MLKGKEARNSCLLSIKVAFLQSFVIEDYLSHLRYWIYFSNKYVYISYWHFKNLKVIFIIHVILFILTSSGAKTCDLTVA